MIGLAECTSLSLLVPADGKGKPWLSCIKQTFTDAGFYLVLTTNRAEILVGMKEPRSEYFCLTLFKSVKTQISYFQFFFQYQKRVLQATQE